MSNRVDFADPIQSGSRVSLWEIVGASLTPENSRTLEQARCSSMLEYSRNFGLLDITVVFASLSCVKF
jgi:hypothetical protein